MNNKIEKKLIKDLKNNITKKNTRKIQKYP
jgi:hypothetical protein